MNRFLTSIFTISALVLIVTVMILLAMPHAHSAAPLGVYGCAEVPNAIAGFGLYGKVQVCKVWDPENSGRFIVVTSETGHGTSVSVTKY
jgi:hypothetical protein